MKPRVVVVFCSLVLIAGRHAAAAPLSAAALFLSPTSVPTADYTVGRTFSSSSDSLHLTFTPGSLPDLPFGSTLTGARILPLLNPNPATAEGDYSSTDLAAINVGNYATYFFRQPGTDSTADYWADLESDALGIHFDVSGQYFLELDYMLGGVSASTGLYHVQVDDFFVGDGTNEAGVERTMDGPTTDFNVVSTGDDTVDNAATELTNRLGAGRVARAGTLQQACDAIKKASKDAGKKISVSLVGHGAPGSIQMGTESIGADGTMTATQFQECIDAYVSSIEFYSCETAQGDAGAQFLKDFAASIGSASGFNVWITATNTYWDISAGGRKITATAPEPATLVLLGTTLLACAFRVRRVRPIAGD